MTNNNSTQQSSVSSDIRILMSAFPNAFFGKPADKKPLKVGIAEDLFQNPPSDPAGEQPLSRKRLRRAVSAYCRETHYRQALIRDDHRIDLDGNVCGNVTDTEKEHALTMLHEEALRIHERMIRQAA